MKHIFPIAVYLLVPFWAIIPACSQSVGRSEGAKKITIHMEKQPLGNVFRFLMDRYQVSIGFEESVLDRGSRSYLFQTNGPSTARENSELAGGAVKVRVEDTRAFDSGEHPITVNVEEGDVKEVFDQIVPQMKNYSWKLDRDVVNIFPVKGRDARFRELLETRIGSFRMPQGKTVRDITYILMGLPEFSGWLRSNNLRFNPARTGPGALLEAQYGRPIESGMEFKELTFRELLNSITTTKRGGWSLTHRGILSGGEEHINLDI